MNAFGTSHFVHYREVVLSSEAIMYRYNREVTPKSVLYGDFFLLCPLFGVSIIRGSTVLYLSMLQALRLVDLGFCQTH